MNKISNNKLCDLTKRTREALDKWIQAIDFGQPSLWTRNEAAALIRKLMKASGHWRRSNLSSAEAKQGIEKEFGLDW